MPSDDQLTEGLDQSTDDGPQYEYKVVHHDGVEGEYPLETVLNNFGKKGWRYVGDLDDNHVVLERVEQPAVISRVKSESKETSRGLDIFN